MELKITKLYGKKDYDINFDKNLNILIGPNGSGKSTIINILDCIFSKDFESLSKYKFEKITLKDDISDKEIYQIKDGVKTRMNEYNIEFKYDDLKTYDFARDIKFRVILSHFLNEYDFNSDIEEHNFNFDNFFKQLSEKAIKEGTGKYRDYTFKEESKYCFGVDFDKNFDSVYHNLNDLGKRYLVLNYDYNIPYGSKIYFYNIYLTYIQFHLSNKMKDRIVYLPIYNDFIKTENSSDVYFGGFRLERESLYKYPDNCIVTMRRNNQIDIYRMKPIYVKGNEKLTYYEMFRTFYGVQYDLFDIYGYSHGSKDYVRFKDKKQYRNSLLTEKGYTKLIKELVNIQLNADKFDYGQILGPKEMYDDGFFPKGDKEFFEVYDLAQKFKDFTFPIEEKTNDKELFEKALLMDNIKENTKSDLKKIIEENYSREDYILEILKGDITDMMFVDGKISAEGNRFIYSGIFHFNEIREHCIDIDLSSYYDTKEALTFITLTKKYFPNKKIVPYYTKEGFIAYHIYDRKTNVELSEDNLSSGEYKMFRIIKMIAFEKKEDISLLDEPELSLSLYWQEMLLDDIKKYSKAKKFIIATQSTYLVNERHIENLKEVE